MKGKAIIQAFENSDEVLSYNFSELALPIWPFVRFAFLDRYSACINNLSPTSSAPIKGKYTNLLKSFVRSVYKNPYLVPAKDVLFFNSAVTNIELQDGRYFNRVTDYFYYQLQGRSALIEDLLQFKTVTNRVHPDVYSILPLKLAEQALAMLPALKLRDENFKAVDQLIRFLKINAPVNVSEKFWQDCFTLFISHLSKVQAGIKLYKQFFGVKRPKLLFLEDAAYGSKLPLLLAAKSLHIPVAELQHGLVNENHLAYQFGEGVVDKLTPFLPDHFLSYSQYWSDLINLPSNKVEIGNPYLEEFLQKFPKKTSHKVLILGTGMSTDQLITFCNLLHSNPIFSGYQFILRPHPWEKGTASQKYAELLALGYKLDDQNLYESLSSCAVIFGEMSTAIYEASIYNLPVYLIATDHCKTNLSDSNPFPVVSIDQEVTRANFLDGTNSIHQYIWASNWQSNFKRFIRDAIN